MSRYDYINNSILCQRWNKLLKQSSVFWKDDKASHIPCDFENAAIGYDPNVIRKKNSGKFFQYFIPTIEAASVYTSKTNTEKELLYSAAISKYSMFKCSEYSIIPNLFPREVYQSLFTTNSNRTQDSITVKDIFHCVLLSHKHYGIEYHNTPRPEINRFHVHILLNQQLHISKYYSSFIADNSFESIDVGYLKEYPICHVSIRTKSPSLMIKIITEITVYCRVSDQHYEFTLSKCVKDKKYYFQIFMLNSDNVLGGFNTFSFPYNFNVRGTFRTNKNINEIDIIYDVNRLLIHKERISSNIYTLLKGIAYPEYSKQPRREYAI